MKKYSRYNFFKHTFCEFTEVTAAEVALRTPNYKSESGSTYYFDDKGVYRYSNHWGRAANCRWRLLTANGKQNGYRWGYALWTDFFPNNESEKLFYIEVDLDRQEVTYQHKFKLGKEQELLPVFRTAAETVKSIKQIKELFSSDDWAKYLDIEELSSTRERIIREMIYTNKSLMQIKRELI